MNYHQSAKFKLQHEFNQESLKIWKNNRNHHFNYGIIKIKGNKAIILNKILMNISCFLYFLVDHTHWFCKIQVIQNPQLEAKADYWSDALWCFEAFFDCVALILEIREEENKSQDSKSSQRLFNLRLDLLRAFMDLLSAYGFISNGKMPGKWIGFFGTISSIIGLKQQWDAAK